MATEESQQLLGTDSETLDSRIQDVTRPKNLQYPRLNDLRKIRGQGQFRTACSLRSLSDPLSVLHVSECHDPIEVWQQLPTLYFLFHWILLKDAKGDFRAEIR